MITNKDIGWPSKYILGVTILNFILQLVCIPFFPAEAPCHWTSEGIVNGYMSKYFYILYYLIPLLMLWIFARTPKNQLIAYFYDLPQGRIVRIFIVILSILATWIPAYAILFVPSVIPIDQQATWIAGMVHVVEAAVGIAVVLILLTCAFSCVKLRSQH